MSQCVRSNQHAQLLSCHDLMCKRKGSLFERSRENKVPNSRKWQGMTRLRQLQNQAYYPFRQAHKDVIVFGAGPAGLSATLSLLSNQQLRIAVFEKRSQNNYDIRSGIMQLSEKSKTYILKDLEDAGYISADTVFSHAKKSGRFELKSTQNIKKYVNEGYIQTDVLQRILFFSIKTKERGQVMFKFDVDPEQVSIDSKLQTVLMGQDAYHFQVIVHADGSGVFKKEQDNRSSSSLKKLFISLGQEIKIKETKHSEKWYSTSHFFAYLNRGDRSFFKPVTEYKYSKKDIVGNEKINAFKEQLIGMGWSRKKVPHFYVFLNPNRSKLWLCGEYPSCCKKDRQAVLNWAFAILNMLSVAKKK